VKNNQLDIIIQEIEYTNQSEKKVPSIELEFINITPWWGGLEEPKTIRCLDNNCNEYQISLPRTSSVKGLLRWLMRIAVASYIPSTELEKYGYKIVDCFPTCLSTNENIRKLPGLIEVLFGTTRGNIARQGAVNIIVKSRIICGKPFYASKYSIDKFVRELKTITRKIHAGILENLAYCILSKELVLINNRYQYYDERACRDVYRFEYIRDFLKLFSIPRMALLSQGLFKKFNVLSKELFELQPIRENCIKVNIMINVFPEKLRIEEKSTKTNIAFKYQDAIELFRHLIELGLTFFGLGKASSRGFGRFVSKNDDVIGKTDPRDALRNKVERVLKSTERLLIKYYKEENLKKQLPIYKYENKYTKIPRLSTLLNKEYNPIIWINNPRHPCLLPSRSLTTRSKNNSIIRRIENNIRNYCSPNSNPDPCKDIIHYLSAIGKATLKSTWKLYWYYLQGNPRIRIIDYVKKPGFKFHTWCLGLPRSVDINPSKTYSKQQEKEPRPRHTGYEVVTLDKGIYKYDVVVKSISSMFKRWRSPIIFTPFPDKSGILVFWLPFNDVEIFVKGVSKGGKIAKLSHISFHEEYPRKADHVVISIDEGISNQKVSIGNRNYETGKACIDSNSKPRVKTIRSINVCVEEVCRNALDFITFLLERGKSGR